MTSGTHTCPYKGGRFPPEACEKRKARAAEAVRDNPLLDDWQLERCLECKGPILHITPPVRSAPSFPTHITAKMKRKATLNARKGLAEMRARREMEASP